MIVYVVTNPELGWDCVVGVFDNKDYVAATFDEEIYVISEKTVESYIPGDINPIPVLTHEAAEKLCFIEDTLKVRIGDTFHKGYVHNKYVMSVVANHFKDYCAQEGLDCGQVFLGDFENKGQKFFIVCDGFPPFEDYDQIICQGLNANQILCEGFYPYLKTLNIDMR